MKKQNEYLPVFAGLTVSIIFGFSFLFTKIGLNEINNDVFYMLSLRFLVAAIALTVLNIIGKLKVDFKGKKIHILFLLSFFQPIAYFIFETIGIKYTSSSEAGMMIALIPVIVTILAFIFLNERPKLVQVVFVLLSVCGVIFINIMKGEINGNIIGVLFLLGAVLSAGFYNILSRKSSLSFKPVEITFVMMWVGAIIFNMISIIKFSINGDINQYLLPLRNVKFIISILYLGILSSVIAFFMLNYMLSKLEASKSAVFTNLTTIVSIIAGVIILNESFYWYHYIGGIMIIIGVWGTNYYGKSRKLNKNRTMRQ
ncbi:DMT family transporter [Clostridium sp. D2Q-11]|uniref:DMT family transporter n=1 Tax=Anaeromonas frigoriresistens TaxID=2683708 RepID=A0A942UUW9_9FIRM|nr:DMT family transporter [Anaeromonas frigoriresistens]MBS4539553.1 DMT family transporter [Anaeromonas frigoriresistens]